MGSNLAIRQARPAFTGLRMTAEHNGEGDFPLAAPPRISIPSATEDPGANWLLDDARPELYEFAKALRKEVVHLDESPATRERVRLQIRHYYDSRTKGIIHPGDVAAIACAVDRFVWAE